LNSDRVLEQKIAVPAAEAEEYPYRPQPAVSGARDYGLDVGAVRELVLTKDFVACFAAIAFGLFLLCGNLAICPMMTVLDGASYWNMWPVFVLSSALFAEAGLLSTVLVFCSGSFWIRAALSWGVGLCMWSGWALGLLFAAWLESSWPIGEALQFGTLSLALLALCIQAPLWFGRSYLGLRLTHHRYANAGAPPLSIRDYFLATAIVAVSIALARLARPRDWPIEDYWPGWAIAFLCFGGGSLMSVLPGLLLIFWLRWVWIGLAAFLLYGLVVSAAIVIGIETAHPGSFSTDDAFGFTTFLFSIGMFLGIGLALIRACGFILQIGRSQNW